MQADITCLYATEWQAIPGVAAYRVVRRADGVPVVEHLNSVSTASRSGYVTCSAKAVYSAGGATGDVVLLKPDGSLLERVQELSFVDKSGQRDDGGVMDFGGLRHGAHGADLSPDGRALFVPDMCVGLPGTAADRSADATACGASTSTPRPLSSASWRRTSRRDRTTARGTSGCIRTARCSTRCKSTRAWSTCVAQI